MTAAAQAQTTYHLEPNAPNDGTLTGGTDAMNSTNIFFTPRTTYSGGAVAWPTDITSNTKNTMIFGGTTAGTGMLNALTTACILTIALVGQASGSLFRRRGFGIQQSTTVKDTPSALTPYPLATSLNRSALVSGLFVVIACQLIGAEPEGRLSPRAEINLTTSYHQQSTVPLYRNLPITPTITDEKTPGYLAWATADFDRDGDVDLLAVRVDWTAEGEPLEYFENQKDAWVANPAVFGERPPFIVHGRKAIVADFDANGWPDVLIAAHGHDVAPPFKGEKLQVLLNHQGRFTVRELPLPGGFYHSACAGDIDHDGDVDIFVTDALNGAHKICKFLRNDGAGHFTHDPALFPTALKAKFFFTSELHDINADGYLDLVVAGHEMDGTESRILWGGDTGRYTVENSTVLPTVHGYRIVIDIDFVPRKEGGFDVLLNRTGDNKSPIRWYRGYYLQLLSPVSPRVFEDFSIARLRDHFALTGPWITWLRVHDINGDGRPDITSANKLNQQEWSATSSGVFRRAEP